MPKIQLSYAPREQFLPLHEDRSRFKIIVAHRRAGKTVACINHLIRAACTCPQPEPRLAYIAPYYSQAKDVAWGYLKRYGLEIPGTTVNESELRLDLPNKGRVRLYGADNYDRLRGLYLDGVVLDEYGDQDPRAWTDVVLPCLADRSGFAVFIGTPRGQNHFFDRWQEAQEADDWFTLSLPASQTGILAEAELDAQRRQQTPEQYAAEFECSFAGSVQGAYYAADIERLDNEGRISNSVGWDPALEVHTAWDLGVLDPTAVWFFQTHGNEIRVIDHQEASGVGLPWHVQKMRERPYTYGTAILPHDAKVHDLGTGLSRVETLASLGLHQVEVLNALPLEDGINAARMILPRCWFARDKTAFGLKCLRNYRTEWDSKRKVFNSRPLHDWSSHAADAFRYLAQGLPKLGSRAWGEPIAYKNWTI